MASSTSPLDRFTPGTFRVRKNSKEFMTRLGFSLGPLAVVRTDYKCPACNDLHEVWSILCLTNEAYPPPHAIFRTVDDAANFVLDTVDLLDWRTADTAVYKRHFVSLVDWCLKHNGIPMELTKFALEPLSGPVAGHA